MYLLKCLIFIINLSNNNKLKNGGMTQSIV